MCFRNEIKLMPAGAVLTTGGKMKTAIVYKDRSGYWTVKADDNKNEYFGFFSTELEAYKAANRKGYVVR